MWDENGSNAAFKKAENKSLKTNQNYLIRVSSSNIINHINLFKLCVNL